MSSLREHSPAVETNSHSHHESADHRKKKKAKGKLSTSHLRHSTPTVTDTSPSVETSSKQATTERRLITLGSDQQQQQRAIVDETSVNYHSDSYRDQCVDEDRSKSPLHDVLELSDTDDSDAGD